MTRAFIFALLLMSVQVSAIPTGLKTPVPPLHRYTIIREMDYRGINCASTTAPVPVSTPDPILGSLVEPVVVNFIIGWDGQVYEPLVLSGDSERNDREVIRAVKLWRFRPATCNGVPVDTEGGVGLDTL